MSLYRTTHNNTPPTDGEIYAVALRWVQRRAGGLAIPEREQFRAWLAADPRHSAAFAQADPNTDEFDWPLLAGTTAEVLEGLEQRARRRRRRRLAAACCVTAAMLVAGTFWYSPRSIPVPASESSWGDSRASASKLIVVQPQRQTLPDGSVVELRDGAGIAVAFTDAFRGVQLKHGEAHFQVAKDGGRPFPVKAGGVEVRAVGTAFSVQLGAKAVDVFVTEGTVAVDKPAVASTAGVAAPPLSSPLATVHAGNRVVVEIAQQSPAPQVRPIATADADERLAWRIPRLEFSGTSLSEVIAMLNRFAATRQGPILVIAQPDLENLRVSGVLRADKVDALVQMLASDFAVEVERRADGTIALHRTR